MGLSRPEGQVGRARPTALAGRRGISQAGADPGLLSRTSLLKNRAVHFCGVSDIVEPYPEWRAYKKQLTGNEWDYDFRRLFYTWTPDITREKFRPWVEIASRDKTCGWISPGDLWLGPDGAVHIVWTERALDERLRAKFFPEAKQSHAVNYAVVREGKVVLRRTLMLAEEGKPGEIGVVAPLPGHAGQPALCHLLRERQGRRRQGGLGEPPDRDSSRRRSRRAGQSALQEAVYRLFHGDGAGRLASVQDARTARRAPRCARHDELRARQALVTRSRNCLAMR